MQISKAIIFTSAILGSIFLISCEKAEDRAIASAQKCLNGVGENPSGAQACIDIVANIDNDQSNIIKCSATFIKGGLTNSKIIGAFDDADDAPADDREATLIGLLSLGSTAPAKQNASDAFYFCNRTNIPGLAYIASLSRIGTLVDQMSGADTQAQIDDFINNGLPADKEAVGEMVTSISQLYCQGENKDSDLCVDVASAIAQTGTDYAALADLLLAQWN